MNKKWNRDQNLENAEVSQFSVAKNEHFGWQIQGSIGATSSGEKGPFLIT